MAKIMLKRRLVQALSAYGVGDVFLAGNRIPNGRRLKIAGLEAAQGSKVNMQAIDEAGGLLSVLVPAVAQAGHDITAAYVEKVAIPDSGEEDGVVIEVSGYGNGDEDEPAPRATPMKPAAKQTGSTATTARPQTKGPIGVEVYNMPYSKEPPEGFDPSLIPHKAERPLHRTNARGRKPKWLKAAEDAADERYAAQQKQATQAPQNQQQGGGRRARRQRAPEGEAIRVS